MMLLRHTAAATSATASGDFVVSPTYFSKETIEFIKAWKPIHEAFMHRPLHPESTEYKAFLTNVKGKAKELLPLGSIVYLKEGTQKLVIVGRGVLFDDPDTGEQVFADYMGRSILRAYRLSQLSFSNRTILAE